MKSGCQEPYRGVRVMQQRKWRRQTLNHKIPRKVCCPANFYERSLRNSQTGTSKNREGGRERQTDTDRQTERERDRQRQRDRQTDTHTH